MARKILQYIEVGENKEIPDYVDFNLIVAEPFVERDREIRHKLRLWYSVELKEG